MESAVKVTLAWEHWRFLQTPPSEGQVIITQEMSILVQSFISGHYDPQAPVTVTRPGPGDVLS